MENESCFFAFFGSDYYPMGGFGDFKGSFKTLSDAIDCVESVLADSKCEWGQVIDIRTKEQVYGFGESCYFNFERNKQK